MKKQLASFALLFISISAMAAVQVKSIAIPDGNNLYSFEIKSSSDNRVAQRIPLSLGFDTINTFLDEVTPSKSAYLEFGYYNRTSQTTTWFPKTCKILINKNENINVTIEAEKCTIQTA
ncbi:MAG: hypothetical protein NTZ67_03395 [Gammaproteobacteria bacterium]|nr:hypothetical protein [Gammaproteobacteria bacterium]